MLTRPAECRSCPLDSIATGFSEPEGSGSYGVMLMGEALGEHEARDGKPFRPAAPAGSTLERIIKRGGWSRDGFTLYNAVNCRPPKNWLEGAPWEAGAIEHCRVHRERVIAASRPRVIVAMGNVALKTLTAYGGRGATITSVRGYVIASDYGWVVPTLHPSYILQGQQALTGVVIYDISRALEIAKQGFERTPLNYITNPALDDALSFEHGYNPDRVPLSYDIETPESPTLDEEEVEEKGASFNIIRISFSYAQGHAISLPWQQPFIDVAKRLLASAGPKRVWNGNFDNPRLRANGVVINGRIYDVMWCLAGRTRVPLWGGGNKTIKEIVNLRLPVTLVGMNEAGRRTPVRIVAWHRNTDTRKWVAIRTDASRYPIYCTIDHKIWTLGGWKRADEISVGDFIPIPSRGAEDAILGAILGDGYVDTQGYLHIYHSAKQRAWASAKFVHLGIKLRERRGSKGMEVYGATRVGRRWRKRFYRGREKLFVPPRSVVGLAVWYCDDGNWKKFSSGDGIARLCVDDFSLDSQEQALEWLRRRFGLTISLHGGFGTRAILALRRGAATKFFTEVAQFVPPTMQYKLPERFRGTYNGWLEEDVPRWAIVEKIESPIRASTVQRNEPKYCVTVEHPTHRFFTLGGLVSNCWKHLQPGLPRALAFVAPFYGWDHEPWKHLSMSEPGYYSCCDADALQRIGDGVERDLKKIGAWDRVESHVVDVSSVLEVMSRNGLPFDTTRAAEFKGELKAKYDERFMRLQELVPDELKPNHPNKGYKKVPKEVTRAVEEAESHVAETLNASGGSQDLGSDYVDVYVRRKTGMRLIEVSDFDSAYNFSEAIKVERWAKVLPFLPTSWQQVAAYIRYRKHPMGRNRKTRNETTDEDTLKRLWRSKKDEVYKLILECRQLRKVLGTYIEGWKPGSDGRIHATPGFWGKMFRISWRNPNVAGTIKDKDEDYIAAGFRKCVRAREGHVLLEADWQGIEAVLVGYFAQDEAYMRLGRLGVHSFLLSHMVGTPASLSDSDEALLDYFAFLKKKHPQRYDDAKHCIHGTNYGMGPRLMAFQYDMSEREAKALQALYFDLFPKIRDWQKRVCEQAHQQAYLVNPYTNRMWFWDVYHWDSRYQRWIMGEDAKSAISFLPRDTAAGILKDALLRLRDLADEGIMLSSTHDSILTEVPESHVHAIAQRLKREMESPVPELGGLTIGVEVKVGKSWADNEMEVIHA